MPLRPTATDITISFMSWEAPTAVASKTSPSTTAGAKRYFMSMTHRPVTRQQAGMAPSTEDLPQPGPICTWSYLERQMASATSTTALSSLSGKRIHGSLDILSYLGKNQNESIT